MRSGRIMEGDVRGRLDGERDGFDWLCLLEREGPVRAVGR